MFDVRQCFFICLSYLGVIRDRRINVFFNPLCRLKWRSPCNQNSLNGLWMLGTDVCAWVQTWLGIYVGAIGSSSLAGETCPLQIVFAMWYVQFTSVQSFSHVWLFATLWTAACQGSLFFTKSWSLWKLMPIELVLPSNHLILCHPLSSCLQSCPVTGSFLMSQFFTSVKVLKVQFQHWSFQWIVRIDFL